MLNNNFAPFRPATALELLLAQANAAVDAAERSVAAYDETTPRITETDSMGCQYITYPQQDAAFFSEPEEDDEPDTDVMSVHVQLGDLKIVTEFESNSSREEVSDALAEQLSGYANSLNSLQVGPLVIPARYVPGIIFASVRLADEAEAFNVHLYGNGS